LRSPLISLDRLFNARSLLAFVHDVCAAALAWAAMYWLRFNLELPDPYFEDMWHSLLWILPMQAVIFVALGLYRGLWRFASISDLQRIVLAAGIGALLVPVVLVMLQQPYVVPRSVLVLYPIVLIFLMAGSRFAYRAWKEHRLYSPLYALGEPVLVIGAGDAGASLARDLMRSRQWRVVGLLDDDPGKQGAVLSKVRVLGPIRELARWCAKYGVR
jgi:FlaA1/EpsC-like NDP-sugar epimerase